MARQVIDPPVTDKTTIVTSKALLERMSIHVKKGNDNQTKFLTRAIVNQMEREGDLEVRALMTQEGYFDD